MGAIKKFLIKSFILLVFVIVMKLGFVDGFSIMLPMPEHAYNFVIFDKHRLLANTKSPKIVIAGGSNVAFGIDSAAIHDSLHVPVVNMGIHAGFGLGRILDDISPFLHKGDILLIIPEYEHFTSAWNGFSEVYQLIFDFRQFRLLWSFNYSLPESKWLFYYFSTHPKMSILDMIVSKNTATEEPHPEAYTRDGFNEYGDYIKHLKLSSREEIFYHESAGVYKESYLNNFFNFVDAFTKRGITVVLAYPCFDEQSFSNSSSIIQELDTIFKKKENLLVISTPDSYCFPVHYFFDTAYHLNAEGRAVRTEQLISDLQASGLFTQVESY
jgi:hypothetical protein